MNSSVLPSPAAVKLLKDPLFRRFVSAAFFASMFVWVAVEYFNVETEVVRVLFVYSVFFVIGLVGVGLLLFPIVRLLRRKPEGMLAKPPAANTTSSMDE